MEDRFLDQELPYVWGVRSLFLDKSKSGGGFLLAKTGCLYTVIDTETCIQYILGVGSGLVRNLGMALMPTFQLVGVSGLTDSLEAPV